VTTQTFAPAATVSFLVCSSIPAARRPRPGYAIERVTFREPVPLVRGLSVSRRSIRARGRPLTAFGACELRAPAPFTDEGFAPSTRSTSARSPNGASTTPRPRTNPVAAQQRMPRSWTSPRALGSTPSVSRWRRTTRCRPSSSPAVGRRGRAAPATASAPSATARPALTPMRERRSSYSPRWSAA